MSKFIIIEGTDNVGKDTQQDLIIKNMSEHVFHKLHYSALPFKDDKEKHATYSKELYESMFLLMMKSKLGLFSDHENDLNLIQSLEDNLQLVETDMTIFFRSLSNFSNEKTAFELIKKAFYDLDNISGDVKNQWNLWFKNYNRRLYV